MPPIPQLPVDATTLPIGNQQPVFQPGKANQFGPAVTTSAAILPGNLFSCGYTMFKHDQNPLILICKRNPNGLVAAINLHYLTYPYVKWLIKHYCGKSSFGYNVIKNDLYIKRSYRTYKYVGLRKMRLFDPKFLLTVLDSIRNLDPEEVEAMRKSVNEQLKQRMNMKADEFSRQHRDTARKFTQMVQPEADYNLSKDTQSPHDNPLLNIPTSATIPPTPGMSPT